MGRERLTTKQMIAFTLVCLLWIPMVIYIRYCLDHGVKPSPAVGAINLIIGASLLTLVLRWIQRTK